jgi:hypothetical protein
VWYLPIAKWSDAQRLRLWDVLDQCELTAFNVAFDGAWLWQHSGMWFNWTACTLVWFKLLATEGWKGQRWNLETAQADVLGWQVSNKTELDELLAKHSLTKSDMYKLADLEPEAFARYCAQDADAAWQLYQEFTQQCDGQEWGPSVQGWLQRFMIQVRRLAEQQLRGIRLNVAGITKYQQQLAVQAVRLKHEFLAHPDVKPHVDAVNKQVLAELAAKEPPMRDLHAEHLDKEPPRTTADGKPSKRWDAWYLKKAEVDAGPRYNAKWLAWSDRYAEAVATQHFNVNSRDQLCWLFFDKLGYDAGKTTDTGADALDNKVLRSLGEPGKILLEYRKVLKEDGYVRASLEYTKDSVFRPQIRPHGTITGRVAGGFG